jgi:hypothetical protein
MRVLGVGALGVLVVATVVTACATNIEHPSPAAPSAAGATFERDDVRFVAPAGWEVRPSTGISYGRANVDVYLANQPLRDDCIATSTEVTCQPPVADGLRPGGVLVTWIAQECVAQGCQLPEGRLIAIGNRQGVQVALTNGCDETGYTERSAYYVTVTPQRVDVLVVCARDPSTAVRSALAGFLDAIQWRIP